jgi:hypothetical protein
MRPVAKALWYIENNDVRRHAATGADGAGIRIPGVLAAENRQCA